MSDKDQCQAAFLATNSEYCRTDERWMGWQQAWAHLSAELAASREREARAYQHIDWALQMHMPNLPENKDRHYIETRLRLALEALNPIAYAQLVKDETALSQSSAPASEPDVPESGV